MKRMTRLGILAMGVVLCVCARAAAQGTPVEGTVEATGKLVKVMAVGGETSGWAIEFEQEVSFGGNGVHTIEVEGDAKKFAKLENKKVTAKGNIVHRSGTERQDGVCGAEDQGVESAGSGETEQLLMCVTEWIDSGGRVE